MSTFQPEQPYDQILRTVIWGEDLHPVTQELETRGIGQTEIDQLIDDAQRERTTLIRSNCHSDALTGLLLSALGIGLFIILFVWLKIHQILPPHWSGRKISTIIFTALACPTLIGIYKLLNAPVEFFLAHKKQGSVSTEI